MTIWEYDEDGNVYGRYITVPKTAVDNSRKSFETDFCSLSSDGKLITKNAPFNAETAWKATKLASGDPCG